MTAAASAPEPVDVQLERARLDNRDQWRTASIAMLILLIIGIGIPLIPVVAIYTLLATRRNERAARAGVYGLAPEPRVNEKGLDRWIAALALAGLGVALIVATSNGFGVLVGFALIASGIAVRPWRATLRVR